MSEYVDPDDLQVQRDGDGNRVAQTKEAGSFGKVEVKPMAYGDVQEYFGDGQNEDVTAEDMAYLFEEFIVRPDLSRAAGGVIDVEYIENMKPLAPRDLLLALLDASGVEAEVEMDEPGQASVEVQGN